MIFKRNIHMIIGLLTLFLIFTITTVFGNDSPLVAKNIEFVNADLRDVFRSLAAAGNFTVIMEPNVHGDVTLALRYGVTVKDAVAVIAKTYGYSCRWLQDSSTVLVGSARFIQINFDRKIAKVYQLKYADPKEVATALEVVIPKTRIRADLANKQIAVMANDIEISNITELITKMDREQVPIDFEVKLVEVNADIWKKLEINNNYQPPHMGLYVLKEKQMKDIDEMNLDLMMRSHYIGIDNHQLKALIGDKVPLITSKKRKGDINYQVEYIDAGTGLAINSRLNPDHHQLTLVMKAAVSTIANKSHKNTDWVPWVVTRDFESTVRMEVGQTFLLSGLLQRNEYNMMKTSPYHFPELDKLFTLQKSSDQSPVQIEMIALITPRLAVKTNDNQNGTPENLSNSSVPPDVNSDTSVDKSKTTVQTGVADQNSSDSKTDKLEGKLPINEDKPEVKITLSTTNTDEAKAKPNNTSIDESKTQFTVIYYHVKKGDTLTSIVKKFGADLQQILAENKIEQTADLKENIILAIAVPDKRIYILKPKETMWRIAKRYGITLEVLKDLNGINDESKVQAGQIIVLPVANSQIVNPQF